MVKMRYQWPLSYLTDALDFRMRKPMEHHEFVEDGDDDDDASKEDNDAAGDDQADDGDAEE
jgi:hypothetical protein